MTLRQKATIVVQGTLAAVATWLLICLAALADVR